MESILSIVMAMALALGGSGDAQAAEEVALEDLASDFISEHFNTEDLQIEGLGDIDIEQIGGLVNNIVNADTYSLSGVEDQFGIERETTEAVIRGILNSFFGG